MTANLISSSRAFNPRQLPVAIGVVEGRRAGPMPTAVAEFVSQLIAERQHLPPQRTRRQASVAVALGCYDHMIELSVRRLPAGYRKTVIA